MGGTVWNAIDNGNVGATNGSWAACANGTACDWYQVDVSAGQRLSATLSQVFDSLCNLELSVFAPPVQGWWSYFPGPPDLPGTVGYAPIVTDQGGSMEVRGAQLIYYFWESWDGAQIRAAIHRRASPLPATRGEAG